jgi:hypothetical protein
MPTGAASLRCIRHRHHAQHGGGGNDTENRLSHIDLFS